MSFGRNRLHHGIFAKSAGIFLFEGILTLFDCVGLKKKKKSSNRRGRRMAAEEIVTGEGFEEAQEVLDEEMAVQLLPINAFLQRLLEFLSSNDSSSPAALSTPILQKFSFSKRHYTSIF